MADEKKAMTKESIVQSQAAYKGNNHFDLVEVKITKANDYYKVGEKDMVHPTMAAILEEKGLIASGWENKVIARNGGAELLTNEQVDKVLEGDRDINKQGK